MGRSAWRQVWGMVMVLGLGLARAARGDDPGGSGLDVLRRASVAWDDRTGPRRRVVDQVCLVPDIATFFEAIAAWDEGHCFPILIEDVDLTFKFLRAFRPARVVRYPRRRASIPSDRLWDEAVKAVGRSWARSGAEAGDDALRGDAVPARLGPTPPGVVIAAPDSPMLAGAVALAAGRFEPLVRWELPRRFADVLSADDARALALDLETRIAGRVGRYGQIGDDCDFLTLAGDWPYRYQDKGGQNAFDDLVGRVPGQASRWAFAGRLLGDSPASAYRAMCALFLQPDSALLFNTYLERKPPWSDYAMDDAEVLLDTRLVVTHRAGDRADLAGWFRAFDPMNRFGLVLTNTQGGPAQFQLANGTGHPGDIPPSVPAAVLMIHSFSAADPTDPGTIAGRWLANGAFVYFGSMNEPYLQSFRHPARVVALLAERVPFGAALRQSPPEPFGHPWRLVYLGDPLYRLAPAPARLDAWAEVASWPYYEARPGPMPGASDDDRLAWAIQTSIVQAAQGVRRSAVDVADILRAIRRERLSERLRPHYDALLADILLRDNRRAELHERLARIPPGQRTASGQRLLEWCQVARLQELTADHDFERAQALWDEAVRAPAPSTFLERFTARVAALADTPARRASWRGRLRAARRDLDQTPAVAAIDAELKRLDGR
ncbi:MAG TPA: hypothetical protein VKP69_12635 [Isosphaeraceae bacterium]|nr:hypothetical protein [Isosphaeraceae bacterium]